MARADRLVAEFVEIGAVSVDEAEFGGRAAVNGEIQGEVFAVGAPVGVMAEIAPHVLRESVAQFRFVQPHREDVVSHVGGHIAERPGVLCGIAPQREHQIIAGRRPFRVEEIVFAGGVVIPRALWHGALDDFSARYQKSGLHRRQIGQPNTVLFGNAVVFRDEIVGNHDAVSRLRPPHGGQIRAGRIAAVWRDVIDAALEEFAFSAFP